MDRIPAQASRGDASAFAKACAVVTLSAVVCKPEPSFRHDDTGTALPDSSLDSAAYRLSAAPSYYERICFGVVTELSPATAFS